MQILLSEDAKKLPHAPRTHQRRSRNLCQSKGWACKKCDTPSPQTAAPSRPLDEPSQKMETLQRKEIRILQCNADGLLTKWVELGDWLAKDKTDIALVRETKLKAKNGTPKIAGYSNIRFDRPDQLGGGLLCLIKEDIPFTTPKHHNQLSGIVASCPRLEKKVANHRQRLHPPEQIYRRGNHCDRPHSNRCELLHSWWPQWPL